MCPLEPRKPTTVGPDNLSIAEAQEKEFKIAFINMIEVIKEEINNSHTGIYKNTNTKAVERNEYNRSRPESEIGNNNEN